MQDGHVFDTILQNLADLPNYYISYKVLSPSDIGFPQNRPRIFIVGIDHTLPLECRNWIDAGMTNSVDVNSFLQSYEDAVKCQPKVARRLTKKYETMYELLKMKKPDAEKKTYIVDLKMSPRFFSIPRMGISPCITRYSYSYYLSNQKRFITAKESLLIQGFDDDAFWHQISSCMSFSRIYQVAGNSICVPVLRHVLAPIALALQQVV